ncbi:unnamed protein product, partial [Effrenium voratum]
RRWSAALLASEVAVVDAGEMGRALGWKGKNAVMGRPWPRRCCEAEEEAAVVGGAAGLKEVAVVDAGEMGRGKNAVMGRPWPRRCCEAEEEAPGGAAIGVALRGVLGKDSITWRRDSREARPGFHLRRNVLEGGRMRRHRLGTGPPGGVDLFEAKQRGSSRCMRASSMT